MARALIDLELERPWRARLLPAKRRFKEIFPGGQVPCDEDVVEYSGDAGFSLAESQDLSPHYVRTLDTWSASLEAHNDEAVAVTSEQIYERYMKYLTGCSDFFRRGICEVGQFTLVKG